MREGREGGTYMLVYTTFYIKSAYDTPVFYMYMCRRTVSCICPRSFQHAISMHVHSASVPSEVERGCRGRRATHMVSTLLIVDR